MYWNGNDKLSLPYLFSTKMSYLASGFATDI
jgi:hypothetical protein